ncbi:MAG TPA: hypothetical protein VFB01_07475 [Burkholderiales bacterium]|nr:hypothetical protein [Burkholderiales bacterium]
MKSILLVAVALLLAALQGCTTEPRSSGQNMSGFPVDEACAAFHDKSALYGGNRALAYATNCSNTGL